MTNKPMLSVELELLELVTDNKHIDKESICIRRWEALCKLRAILNKPAAQHQGEPVAWLAQAIGKDGEVYRNTASPTEITMRDVGFAWGQGVIDRFAIVIKPLYAEQPAPAALTIPEECPHIIVFDDTDREQLLFAGTGARAAALKKWEKISGSWNAHLFVRVERNSRDDRYPSATPAPVAVVMPEHTMRSVMDAIQQARGLPMLTSNQCHALADSLNYVARLNVVKP